MYYYFEFDDLFCFVEVDEVDVFEFFVVDIGVEFEDDV